MKHLMLSTLALAGFAGAAMAQQPAPTLLGIGTVPCSAWTTERARPGSQEIRLAMIWVEGYVTSFNAVALEPSRNLSEGLTIDQIAAQLDIYCRQAPAQQFGIAVHRTLEDMIRRKGYNPGGVGLSPTLPRLTP